MPQSSVISPVFVLETGREEEVVRPEVVCSACYLSLQVFERLYFVSKKLARVRCGDDFIFMIHTDPTSRSPRS